MRLSSKRWVLEEDLRRLLADSTHFRSAMGGPAYETEIAAIRAALKEPQP